MRFYLDSNVFVYAEVSREMVGKLAIKVLERLEEGELTGVTSCITVDEVVWSVTEDIDRSHGIEVGKKMLELPNIEIVSVTPRIVSKALDKMKETNLKPRDAIHVATMLENNVFSVISEDTDFDKIDEIERLDMKKFLEKFQEKNNTNNGL